MHIRNSLSTRFQLNVANACVGPTSLMTFNSISFLISIQLIWIRNKEQTTQIEKGESEQLASCPPNERRMGFLSLGSL